MKILVLGGTGFIGRHTVAALLARRQTVVVGTRDPRRARPRLPTAAQACERRRVRFERMLAAPAWDDVLRDIDIVVNCVGILRPRGRESHERVHHLAPAALADACVLQGVRRLIHVSALGLHAGAASGFIRSKHRGEQALRTRRLDIAIVRPSLLDGIDGYGARWLRRVARWPLLGVPACARGRIAPLDVRDLADVIAALCELPAAPGVRVFELGGADARTMTEHLAALRRAYGGAPARTMTIPSALAGAIALICDLLHLTPFSRGHLELLRADNVPSTNALPRLLGRAPRWIGVRESGRPARLRTAVAVPGGNFGRLPPQALPVRRGGKRLAPAPSALPQPDPRGPPQARRRLFAWFAARRGDSFGGHVPPGSASPPVTGAGTIPPTISSSSL
jgi:NADH dehydrogenase